LAPHSGQFACDIFQLSPQLSSSTQTKTAISAFDLDGGWHTTQAQRSYPDRVSGFLPCFFLLSNGWKNIIPHLK
jgi:hypothetical protein